jgi:prepilin-type processing-associated H-X9-DG protein
MKKRRPTHPTAYSLIELLVVVSVILILLLLLMPAVQATREMARSAVCTSNLHGLGQAGEAYAATFNDFFAGSPNTSGNGADPGGVGLSLYPGYYERPDPDKQTWPAVHIFDWATPLLMLMNVPIPRSATERYDQSKRELFLCPDNRWVAKLNHESRINVETIVSSYVTSRFLTYAPKSKQTGTSAGTVFWTHKFVPEDFYPKLSRVSNASYKVFLADGCKIDRGDPRRIINADYGYTERGAWLNVDDPETSSLNLAYRFAFGREHSYRHQGGLNLLFFDGHVEHQPEGTSEDNHGLGSGSRQARFWFPSGTDTSQIPNASSFSNPRTVVP